MHQAALSALDQCAQIAAKNLDPSVTMVCGSSWGGAVALYMIANKLWTGKTVLIAPAFKRVITQGMADKNGRDHLEQKTMKVWYDRLAQCLPDDAARSGVVVIHGEKDEIIPLDDSKELCRVIGLKLVTIPEGDHTLNDYLISQKQLIPFISALGVESSHL